MIKYRLVPAPNESQPVLTPMKDVKHGLDTSNEVPSHNKH